MAPSKDKRAAQPHASIGEAETKAVHRRASSLGEEEFFGAEFLYCVA